MMRDILLQILPFLKFQICLKINVRRCLKMTNERTRGERKGVKKNFFKTGISEHIQHQEALQHNRNTKLAMASRCAQQKSGLSPALSGVLTALRKRIFWTKLHIESPP